MTIPLALLIAFICLDLAHIPANLLSIGAIDFGILVRRRRRDGREHLPAAGSAARHRVLHPRRHREAASEVDRPIVYAIAVIVAGFLPIYALSGPSGRLFARWRTRRSSRWSARWSLTLTLIPVLCAVFLRGGVRERRNAVFEWMRVGVRAGLDWCLAHPRATVLASVVLFAASLLLTTRHRRRVHAEARRGRALGPRDDAVHDLVRGVVARSCRRSARILKSFPEVTVVASEHGRPTTAPIRPDSSTPSSTSASSRTANGTAAFTASPS